MLRTRSFIVFCLLLISPPAMADDDISKVLILHPDSESATQVLVGLADEVGEDLNLISVEFSSRLTTGDIDTLLAEHRADALVLMNNPTVELYRAYQQSKPEGTTFPPAVMLLTSFLEKTAVGIQNATGINYEVAAVSSMVNLRSLIESKVERVGVVYRDIFEDFVREQQVMAAQEKINLYLAASAQPTSTATSNRSCGNYWSPTSMPCGYSTITSYSLPLQSPRPGSLP